MDLKTNDEFLDDEILTCIDYQLCASNAIRLIQKEYAGNKQYPHVCKYNSEYHAKKWTIHFNQNRHLPFCEYGFEHHPEEFDALNQQRYDMNRSCGYILLKVLLYINIYIYILSRKFTEISVM